MRRKFAKASVGTGNSAFEIAPAHMQREMQRILEGAPVIPLISNEDHQLFRQAVDASFEAYDNCRLGRAKPVIEVLFRSAEHVSAAMSAVERIKEELDDQVRFLAGSALWAADVDYAKESGFSGVVSGGYDREIARACRENQIPYLPGFMTLEEVNGAISAGYKIIKLFPASAPAKAKDILAPLSRLQSLKTYAPGEAGAPADLPRVATASQAMRMYLSGRQTMELVPADTSSEMSSIFNALLEADAMACCTGGVSYDNLGKFSKNPVVAGVGASYLVADAKKAGAGFEKELAAQMANSILRWYNSKPKEPASQPDHAPA